MISKILSPIFVSLSFYYTPDKETQNRRFQRGKKANYLLLVGGHGGEGFSLSLASHVDGRLRAIEKAVEGGQAPLCTI